MKKMFNISLFLLSLATTLVFANPSAQYGDYYKHTYYSITNNTGKTLYLEQYLINFGHWEKPIPTTLSAASTEYSNVLSSFVYPLSNEVQGQTGFDVCNGGNIYRGKAYCEQSNNFCTINTVLDSKYAPHHYANVNMQSGNLVCTVQKTVTPDGMRVNFTINKK